MPVRQYTLDEAFEHFQAQSNLSPGTLATYTCAAQHFFSFLKGSRKAQALSLAGPDAPGRSLSAMGGHPEDVNLLAWIINYPGQEVESAHADPSSRSSQDRRLEPATVRLYGQVIVSWFAFLADELLLPDRFPASAAIARANRRMRTHVPKTAAREAAPEPPEDPVTLIHAFDDPSIDASLPCYRKSTASSSRRRGIVRCSMRWLTPVPE
jgi:hypothetical protein